MQEMTERLHILLPRPMADRLRSQALREERSLGFLIRKYLERALREQEQERTAA